MQGGGEVQAGTSGNATPACGARGGRPLFPAFARLDCARRMTKNCNLARGAMLRKFVQWTRNCV
eukprot:2517554-Prymnesium_polylepis.1